MKKRLLFIGHDYHKKTRSADFLGDILCREYDITRFYLDPQCADSYGALDELEEKSFDVVICWQVMPSPSELRKRIFWRHGVFFPMYDYYQGCMTLDREVWYEYADFTIINFSKTLHERLKGCGFDSRYIQYFPEPADRIDDWGEENSLYFWQRLTSLNLQLVARVLKGFGFRRLHVHKVLDPGETFTPIPADGSGEAAFFRRMEVSESTWYDTREEMRLDMLRASVYMAPRPYEGIGMSFLEAMANGRCVVAPDCPTMNEYITDGENGLLYHWDGSVFEQRPAPIGLPKKGIREIQRAAYEFICRGYAQWQEEQSRILEWVADDLHVDRPKIEAFAKQIGWVDSPIEDQPRPNPAELSGDILVKHPSRAADDGEAPDVTVVTVVFNAIKSGRRDEFLQCLDSVQRQTGVRLEHLVVDGGSTDGTRELVERYSNPAIRIRLLSKRDCGIYDAMNRGLWLAQGKYVTFLNSDDFYHDARGMAEAFACLEKTACDFSYAPIRVLGEGDGKPIDHPNAHPNVGKIFVNMEFSHQSVVVRRDKFIGIRGFDLRYRSAADYDSVLRLILTGHRACFVPHSYVTFRMGGFSCVNMAKSQRESGTIFARLYNKYAGASLTREDGLRIYLTSCFPLELKERLFAYFVSAFGTGTLERETADDAEARECMSELSAFKCRLLPLKRRVGPIASARLLLFELVRHPLWLTEFVCHYRKAVRLYGRDEAAHMAFDDMGRRVLGRRHGKAYARALNRRAEVTTPALGEMSSASFALPVRTCVNPSDFWNVYGTYEIEPCGVWATKDMLVKMRIPDEYVGKELGLELSVGGYVFNESPVRTLDVTVNGTRLPSITLDSIAPQMHALRVPAEAVKEAVLDVRLSVDGDFVPAELGHGTDTRRLGLFFGWLRIQMA